MKRHLTISTTVTLTALIILALFSRQSVDAQQDNRAQTLLAQARSALGGDDKLKAIQALSTTAKFRIRSSRSIRLDSRSRRAAAQEYCEGY